MDKILVLAGDGIGPSLVSSAVKILEVMCDNVDISYGDIGFTAYEATGHYLPMETMDLASENDVIFCGPAKIPKEATGSDSNPAELLKIQLDLYAKAKVFSTPAEDLGVKDMNVTLWGSTTSPGKDVVETRDMDGITLTKYVRSASYSRMMARALTDLEYSGKKNVACLTRDDIFPESSHMFKELFNTLFDKETYNTELLNICEWANRVVRAPHTYDYVVCADLYSNVAAGMLAGLTGGTHITPEAYVGDNHLMLMPGEMDVYEDIAPEYANPTSAITASAMALFSKNRKQDAQDIMNALHQTYAAGERTPEFGGTLTTTEFTDAVLKRI